MIEANRQWYEIWVPQDPMAWKLPKIIFPDISASPKFLYDADGCVVDGNCYWITLANVQNPELIFLILGIANSKLMTRYHDLVFNNKLYAGRRRYLTQYVEKYPLPDPENLYARHIIQAVKELVLQPTALIRRSELEQVIEELVAKAFGVSMVD